MPLPRRLVAAFVLLVAFNAWLAIFALQLGSATSPALFGLGAVGAAAGLVVAWRRPEAPLAGVAIALGAQAAYRAAFVAIAPSFAYAGLLAIALAGTLAWATLAAWRRPATLGVACWAVAAVVALLLLRSVALGQTEAAARQALNLGAFAALALWARDQPA